MEPLVPLTQKPESAHVIKGVDFVYLFILAKIFNLLLPVHMKAEQLSILLKPMLEYKLHPSTVLEFGDVMPEDEDEDVDPDFLSLMDHKDIRMLS